MAGWITHGVFLHTDYRTPSICLVFSLCVARQYTVELSLLNHLEIHFFYVVR